MTISPLLWTYYQYWGNPRGQINEEKPARMTHDMEMGLDVFQDFTIFVSHIYPKSIIVLLNAFPRVNSFVVLINGNYFSIIFNII